MLKYLISFSIFVKIFTNIRLINQLQHIQILILKEFKTEFRNKNSLLSSFVFIISTSFITYLLTQNQLTTLTWSVFFWIINLFTSFNLTQNSFSNDHAGYLLYSYTLFSPNTYIISKIIFLSSTLSVLSTISLLIWFFLGIQLSTIGYWILLLVMNSVVVSSVLSITSFMSAKIAGNFSVIAILSLPILMPNLMIISKISKCLIQNMSWMSLNKYFYSEGLLMIISAALSLVLFPYIWKE